MFGAPEKCELESDKNTLKSFNKVMNFITIFTSFKADNIMD